MIASTWLKYLAWPCLLAGLLYGCAACTPSGYVHAGSILPSLKRTAPYAHTAIDADTTLVAHQRRILHRDVDLVIDYVEDAVEREEQP